MRAVVLDGPGPVEGLQIRELPTPVPNAGWVLIRVHAFGLNRSELHTRLGLAEGMKGLQPEMLMGTPWHTEYMQLNPKPENFASLVEKNKALNAQIPDFTDSQIKSFPPTLLIIGDADIIQPEHSVEFFRLLGGGGSGDTPAGMPNSQLAVIPGASHVTVVAQTDVLLTIIPRFLDAPVK